MLMGEGTLLTTKECLLNRNRNAHLAKEQIEEEMKYYLNISKIIWLNKGLFGDETDGHVDNVACFAKPGMVIMQTCYDSEDPNYIITKENMEILRNSKECIRKKSGDYRNPTTTGKIYRGSV